MSSIIKYLITLLQEYNYKNIIINIKYNKYIIINIILFLLNLSFSNVSLQH